MTPGRDLWWHDVVDGASDQHTPEAFDSDPRLVWEWYTWRRRLVSDAERVTQAHLRTVTNAAHKYYSKEFDRHMANVAKVSKENYHHLYEFSSTGGGYDNVGKQSMQLWTHTVRSTPGAAVNFSWQWLPAKQYNPTYRQRRMGRIGHDAMREIPKEQFDTLVEKSKNRRYKFIWKAPMLEYSIPRQITPSAAKWLFLPAFGFTSPMAKSHPGWRFTKSYVATQEPPGNSAGMFTSAWTAYWGSLSEEKWDRIGGDAMVKALDAPVDKGVNKLTKKARNKTVKFMQPSDFSMAYKEGKKHARDAMDMYTSRLNVMNMSSEWKVWSDGSV